MKKLGLYLTVAACGFLALPTHADGAGSCSPTCAPCCETGSFDGFYIGGNLGVLGLEFDRRDIDGFLTDNSGWSATEINVTAGLQVGYDWQCSCSLFGLVVDWNWANNNRKLLDNPNAGGDNAIDSDFEWFTTLRGKAGFTLCDTAFYLTAGAAVGSFETSWIDSDNSPTPLTFDDTRWGWIGGVGIEYLVGCNFSLGAELLYMQFPDTTETFADAAGTRFAFGQSDSIFMGRILLNYRFGDLCSFCK